MNRSQQIMRGIKTIDGQKKDKLVKKTKYHTDRVIYVHVRADTYLPFYVGYGSPRRPYDRRGRNKDWVNVCEQHGVVIEILLTNLHENVAIILESWLIASYFNNYGKLSHGGMMVNKSNGGYGASGWQMTEEQLDKMRVAQKIIQNRPESKALISMLKSGASNPNYGKFGEKHPRFKGFLVGISRSQFVILSGSKQAKEKGFNNGAISSCISGRVSYCKHKGFSWFRRMIIDHDELVGLTPFDEQSAAYQNAYMDE